MYCIFVYIRDEKICENVRNSESLCFMPFYGLQKSYKKIRRGGFGIERYKKLILFGEEKTFFRKNAYVRKKLCKSIKSPGNVEFRQRPVQIKAIQKNVL